jgi:hypothetical protein
MTDINASVATPHADQVRAVILQPQNSNMKYESLFNDIDTGRIKLPMFQRDFVWDKERSAKLIDSILKGYPIGTFIFWGTREHLRSHKNVGNHALPTSPVGDYAQYILDGQQRITSLYAIRKGIRLTRDNKEVDYRDIFIDLDLTPGEVDEVVVTERKEGRNYVAVHDLLSKSLFDFVSAVPPDKLQRLGEYYKMLTTFDFSTITIKDYPIEIACEIFSRINTGGKALTVFEIMVAKTYDEARGFDLAEKFDLLTEGTVDEPECLKAAKFDTLSPSTVMQCVSALTVRGIRGKDILKIPRPMFIEMWDPMRKALFEAIDFVRSELRVPVSQLVPYEALMIPLAYFFYQTGGRKVTIGQARRLEQFFYWGALTSRYGGGTEAKVADDLDRMDAIIAGGDAAYPPLELSVAPEAIAAMGFSTAAGACRGILCLLASNHPKSFDTNGMVMLDNSNLRTGSGKNYHHFFPKDHLKGIPNSLPNLVANITLIDGFSNKHIIGKRAPNDYLVEFGTQNPHLADTLATHLIGDMAGYGIDDNDYGRFIARRSAAIAMALNVKLLSMTPAEAAMAESALAVADNAE